MREINRTVNPKIEALEPMTVTLAVSPYRVSANSGGVTVTTFYFCRFQCFYVLMTTIGHPRECGCRQLSVFPLCKTVRLLSSILAETL